MKSLLIRIILFFVLKKELSKKLHWKISVAQDQSGVNAITIIDGDELLEAKMTDGNSEIMMAVKSGRAIRFSETKARPTGRGAIGVAGIEVDDDNDEVVGMICVNAWNRCI